MVLMSMSDFATQHRQRSASCYFLLFVRKDAVRNEF